MSTGLTIMNARSGTRKLSGRRAFTLLELLVAVALAALLATMVAVSLAGIGHRHDLAGAAEEAVFFDALTRQQARQFGQPLVLVIDPLRQELRRMKGPQLQGAPLRLEAHGIHLVRWMMGPSASQGTPRLNVRGTPVRTGTDPVTVVISAEGLSSSYGLEFSDARGQGRWVIVAGLTGQSMQVSDAKHAEATFNLTAPGQP